MLNRRTTRRIAVGGVPVGGGAPVSVQTMCDRDSRDVAALAEQVASVAGLGCDICRLAVPDAAAVAAFAEVRRSSPIPLVADVHFDWRLAVAAIDAGADAVRINPGNIGGADRAREVAAAAKANGAAIRVGVNLGSLEKPLADKVAAGEMTAPEALSESAVAGVAVLEDAGFGDIVVSVKASVVSDAVAAYRAVSKRTDCPLHVGVTEAGTAIPGTARSAVALTTLLSEGIGDTIRVSLTSSPEDEVRAGLEILRSLGLRPQGPVVTSCPTCGRARADVARVAAEVEAALERVWADRRRRGVEGRFPKVAVMGCSVNGPGEARGADVALCGLGDGGFSVWVNGSQVGVTPAGDAAREVVKHVVSI
jgi:(E)-4-hydroxy-3-methylbut-2-enyl-diphosphate synthase